MNPRRSRLAALVVGFIVIVAAGYFWLTQEVIYLAATSIPQEIVATVTWNTTPLGMVDSHLVVRDFYGATLYRRSLLKNQDHFVNIWAEFQGLEITDDAIVLRVKRDQYNGPDRFELPKRKQANGPDQSEGRPIKP